MGIALRPEVEDWVRAEADREGVTPEQVMARAIEAHWAVARRIPHLSGRESELLEAINEGFPQSFWDRFRELRDRANARTIADAEYVEYLELIEQMETRNAARMEALLELANLRKTSLNELMAELGIAPIKA